MTAGTETRSQTLLTDLYQLTMAYGYWHRQIHDRPAVFHLFFRECPFGGSHAIAAGLGPALQWLQDFKVAGEDVDYLRTLLGNDGKPLFPDAFLTAISGMRLELDVDAIPEGTAVFANEPMVRVSGPLWQCQWVETALLNAVNFQTLIATKASRVCASAAGDPVLEFGLRRAQGIDGALSASRAAYLGGCAATSNLMAGKLLGIPVKGTHAHSWVMSFDDELTSFQAYADALPNNCVFLVDTYDTITGVRNAITVANGLADGGHRVVGIRLDSGDLSRLSIEARKMLDAAGMEDAVIVASNDLDEHKIANLKAEGATIAVWGVGTQLVTGGDQPALGGVFKLGAISDERGQWQPRIKLSDTAIKTSVPGIQQVRRYKQDDRIVADVIYSELLGAPAEPPFASGSVSSASADVPFEDLLRPMMRAGQTIASGPPLEEIRRHATRQRELIAQSLPPQDEPRWDPVQLESRLAAQKETMIVNARRQSRDES